MSGEPLSIGSAECAGLASDELGRELDIVITISADGRISFQDLTVDVLPVALALCPDDQQLRQRCRIARRYPARD